MQQPVKITVLTIGHSNRSVETFLELLEEQKIRILIDIRSFSTSKFEHFKREEMERWLSEHGVKYVWLGKELGGYRRGGYQAHMKTRLFSNGVKKLLELAKEDQVCIMCMEKNPKYCHRRFLSAHLERKGVGMVHILEKGQVSLVKFKDVV